MDRNLKQEFIQYERMVASSRKLDVEKYSKMAESITRHPHFDYAMQKIKAICEKRGQRFGYVNHLLRTFVGNKPELKGIGDPKILALVKDNLEFFTSTTDEDAKTNIEKRSEFLGRIGDA